MKVWRLGSYESSVGIKEEHVFDAFIDSEPVERAQDESDMTGLSCFDDSTSKSVLGLLETG